MVIMSNMVAPHKRLHFTGYALELPGQIISSRRSQVVTALTSDHN